MIVGDVVDAGASGQVDEADFYLPFFRRGFVSANTLSLSIGSSRERALTGSAHSGRLRRKPLLILRGGGQCERRPMRHRAYIQQRLGVSCTGVHVQNGRTGAMEQDAPSTIIAPDQPDDVHVMIFRVVPGYRPAYIPRLLIDRHCTIR